MNDSDALITLRSCIQKVATGPEYSKYLSFGEAHAAMRCILSDLADPVHAAAFLIVLRMKHETDDDKGVLQGIIDGATRVEAPVDELVDVADPYDGYSRGLPASPFLPAVLAACGVPAIPHGLEAVGPKFGVTHRKILRYAAANIDLAPVEAAERLAMPGLGWAYRDQRQYCAPLHELITLRQRIVKRQVLTTVETLVKPVRARGRTRCPRGRAGSGLRQSGQCRSHYTGSLETAWITAGRGGRGPQRTEIRRCPGPFPGRQLRLRNSASPARRVTCSTLTLM